LEPEPARTGGGNGIMKLTFFIMFHPWVEFFCLFPALFFNPEKKGDPS
jgi:hypothetical protein